MPRAPAPCHYVKPRLPMPTLPYPARLRSTGPATATGSRPWPSPRLRCTATAHVSHHHHVSCRVAETAWGWMGVAQAQARHGWGCASTRPCTLPVYQQRRVRQLQVMLRQSRILHLHMVTNAVRSRCCFHRCIVCATFPQPSADGVCGARGVVPCWLANTAVPPSMLFAAARHACRQAHNGLARLVLSTDTHSLAYLYPACHTSLLAPRARPLSTCPSPAAFSPPTPLPAPYPAAAPPPPKKRTRCYGYKCFKW